MLARGASGARLPGWTRRLLLLALAFCLVLPVASARADQVVVDFESGPELGTAVEDQYEETDFVRFLKEDRGFRPYRTEVGGRAHSGTVVADVGPDVCTKEGYGGAECEFAYGGTTGRLTRSAKAVTLYAGLFEPALSEVKVKLIAYAGETVVGESTEVAVNAGGFDTPVTVSAPAENIDRFYLEALEPGGLGAPIGFDDLTIEFPKESLPEVSLSVPLNPISVLAGASTETPIEITRLNGSKGPLHFSVSGLPLGVRAEMIPNPLTGTKQSAVLKLTAEADAPEAIDPATITLTADPEGNGEVAQKTHSAQMLVRVARPYQLLAGAPTSEVALPDCASVDVPITVARDQAFTGTVTLSVEGLPAGVSAQILPSATIPPGGNLYTEVTLRLSRTVGALLPANVVLRGASEGLGDQMLALHLTHATGTATLRSGLGLTPRRLTAGTSIAIDGNGFCPGTTVNVGNSLATAEASVAEDGKSLTFNVPRLATTGPVTIHPPAPGPSYETSTALNVATFRNTNGFSFENPPFGSLSLSELTEAFGADDLFFEVNPCWPWGNCKVVTGILDPLAAVEWGVIDVLAHESGGHCFGISRAVEQFLNHKVPYNRFAQVSSAFELPSPSGPSADLMSYLDAQHVLQFSDQFLRAWLDGRHASLEEQLATLHKELAAGRDPIITMQGPHFGEGHAVIAYDEERTAEGGVDVFVYDSNRPFEPGREADGAIHKAVATEESVIHFKPGLDPEYFTWSFDIGGAIWSGGSLTTLASDGTLFVAPQSIIPDNPSLPGLGALSAALGFGSSDRSVKTVSASAGAQLFPALDSHAMPAGGGYWLAQNGGQTLTAKFEGVKTGHYSEVFTSPGFAGSVVEVPTAAKVKDSAGGVASRHAITFASGMSRLLQFALASRSTGAHGAKSASAKATTWNATLDTHASANGQDTVGLAPSGSLAYNHQGAATAIAFSLTRVRANGGPEEFRSGRVAVGRGASVSVQPLGGELKRVRLTIRDRAGHRRSRVLRNRARPPLRLAVTRLGLAGHHKVRVRAHISRLHGSAVLGVVLRLMHGSHTVARHTFALAHAKNGTRTFTWRLPKRLSGSYRLRANALAATSGGKTSGSGSARVARSARVSVR